MFGLYLMQLEWFHLWFIRLCYTTETCEKDKRKAPPDQNSQRIWESGVEEMNLGLTGRHRIFKNDLSTHRHPVQLGMLHSCSEKQKGVQVRTEIKCLSLVRLAKSVELCLLKKHLHIAAVFKIYFCSIWNNMRVIQLTLNFQKQIWL